jgi:hypothetical protein
VNVKQAMAFLKQKGYEVKLGRSTASKTLLVVSDIHVGNIYAVCSAEPMIANTAQIYKLPRRNQLLLEHWTDCRDWCQNPHLMIINGEPIDGPNKKEQGGDTWSNDANDQIDDVERLLKMHNPKRYVFTRGSNYHVKDGAMSFEETLARRLNALGYNPDIDVQNVRHASIKRMGTHNRYVEYYLWFKILDQICNFTHHTSYTSRHGQRANAVSNEMSSLEFDRGWYYPADKSIAIVGRGHVHYFTLVQSPSTTGFTTPGWKLPDGFLFKNGLGGTRPHIGAVKVIIEPNGRIEVDKLLSKTKFPRPACPDWTDV